MAKKNIQKLFINYGAHYVQKEGHKYMVYFTTKQPCPKAYKTLEKAHIRTFKPAL